MTPLVVIHSYPNHQIMHRFSSKLRIILNILENKGFNLEFDNSNERTYKKN